jgi:mono/diheme cytochrome c family protein
MRRLVLGSLVLVAAAAASAAGQTTGPRVPPLAMASLAGHDLFQFYCASCHGRDAQGRGPAAAALKTRPSDLTLLALRNDGYFPRARVEAIITGGASAVLPSHGSSEMPVWGLVFRGLDPSDATTRTRIANLVAYLESIQQQQRAQ